MLQFLWPTQRLLWTREGVVYITAWIILLVLGLQQEINLILLVAGLAAGPVAASFMISASMLRKLRVSRRVPAFAFAGDTLRLDYTLENSRRWTAALALFIEDALVPVDRGVSGGSIVTPKVFYARVPGGARERLRWTGVSPRRGRYKLRTLELVTRSPFGLLERRVTVSEPDELLVYPTVGKLSRRWHHMNRQAAETRRGQRHERSTQQQEYHGLRDYRPGDSPRWIHWRTSARLGQPMVKEFEQQNEQDIAVLIDPWLPRTKASAEQRDALEMAVQFAATLCLETCRSQGRRIVLGWTGATPGVRQGPASVKLLHELLEQLAVMRASSEGSLSSLFDALPASALREAIVIVVSTRPVNLVEEAERSERLAGGASRGLLGRLILLDASGGDLDGLVEYESASETNGHARPGAAHGRLSSLGPATEAGGEAEGTPAAPDQAARNGKGARP